MSQIIYPIKRCNWSLKTCWQAEWENNLDPLLALLESVHGGVKGRVVDQDGEVLPEAAIKVELKDEVFCD